MHISYLPIKRNDKKVQGSFTLHLQADRDGNGRLDQAEFTKLWVALKQEGPVSDYLQFYLFVCVCWGKGGVNTTT